MSSHIIWTRFFLFIKRLNGCRRRRGEIWIVYKPFQGLLSYKIHFILQQATLRFVMKCQCALWRRSFVLTFHPSGLLSHSLKEIIHNFPSAIRQCLTVIEFWYGAIIHHLRLFALIWNINGFFWVREEMSIWSQRSSTTPGTHPLTLPSILCTVCMAQVEERTGIRERKAILWTCGEELK